MHITTSSYIPPVPSSTYNSYSSEPSKHDGGQSSYPSSKPSDYSTLSNYPSPTTIIYPKDPPTYYPSGSSSKGIYSIPLPSGYPDYPTGCSCVCPPKDPYDPNNPYSKPESKYTTNSKYSNAPAEHYPTGSETPYSPGEPYPTESKNYYTPGKPYTTDSETSYTPGKPYPTESKKPYTPEKPYQTESKNSYTPGKPYPTDSENSYTSGNPYPTDSATSYTTGNPYPKDPNNSYSSENPYPTGSETSSYPAGNPYPRDSKNSYTSGKPYATGSKTPYTTGKPTDHSKQNLTFTPVIGAQPKVIERRSIDVLLKDHEDLFNILTLALDSIQKRAETNDLSYYQLSGKEKAPLVKKLSDSFLKRYSRIPSRSMAIPQSKPRPADRLLHA